jgi:hypothetical protein
LTLYLANNPYQIATFTQALGIGSTLTYAIDGHLGPGSARTCGENSIAPAVAPSTNYQDFCSSYSGSSLVFNQSTTEGGAFEFCPTVSLPIPGTLGIGVAAVGCHGLATLAYDVNVTPRVGYARIVPSFALTIRGSLTAKAVVVQGEADVDLTLGEINNSSAGFIYGIFNDPFHPPGSTVLAYRPFAYYQAKALPVDLTLSLKTIWGSHVQKVFHLYAGFSETSQDDRPLNKADWHVMKLLAPPSPAPAAVLRLCTFGAAVGMTPPRKVRAAGARVLGVCAAKVSSTWEVVG